MKHWFLLLLASWVSAAQAELFESELLPADQAFAFQAAVDGENRVRAVWTIADGYYLYRNKFRFATETEGVRLGEPVFPKGKIKHDEFFGEIETYRDEVVVEVPVINATGKPIDFELRATSQGCADIGVCYPPHTQLASLSSAPGGAAAPDSKGAGTRSLTDLGMDFGLGGDDELLPAEQAFQPDAEITDADTLTVSWLIADGYYLYRHKFEFAIQPTDSATLLPAELPEGEHKTDEFFGEIQVYHQQVQAKLPLRRSSDAATPVTLTVKYQGCAELGVCYPPMTRQFDLILPVADATAATAPSAAAAPSLSEQDAIAKRLSEGNLLAILLAFFGFGLLLAFTPCVFPMIPILSSIIVGQGKAVTTRRSFLLSLVYVLAMAATYTIAGIIAGKSGENLQAAFQNPWILAAFAGVFVALSLSMFGLYDLQMPTFIQSRLTDMSNRQQGGSLAGVAVMGFLSALIVGPCVAAPLMGALIYIGQTGDSVLGGMALFALSMGMGAPLIAIGTGAGKLLPRAGKWMDAVKAVFGVLLLAVAIWMLERILPPAVVLGLWAALLILSSVYLHALDPLPVEATGWSRLWKGVGVVSLAYGILLLIGAASGASDPLRPLQGVLASEAGVMRTDQQPHLAFQRIKTVGDLDRELGAARERGQAVMVDFYADWCVSCKEMEKYTFAETAVQEALSGLVLLQADVTANDDADKALLKRFNLIGPPSILFFDNSGAARPELSLVGFKPADEFIAHVGRLD